MDYRKELKFIVGDDVFCDARNRISALMRIDPHQKGDHYRIRSVYFDSIDHVCYRENIAGVSPREKYRIRTYDAQSSVISAEIKIRHRDTISKMSKRISKELFDILVSGDTGSSINALRAAIAQDHDSRVLEKWLDKVETKTYRPACIVDYERSAYIYDIGNVRITFDRNITGSVEYSRLFDDFLPGRAVFPAGMHVLEIKYDEILPDEIEQVLSGVRLMRTSCSKYAKCAELFM